MKLLGLIASALALDYDDLDKGKNKGSKRPAKVETFDCGGVAIADAVTAQTNVVVSGCLDFTSNEVTGEEAVREILKMKKPDDGETAVCVFVCAEGFMEAESERMIDWINEERAKKGKKKKGNKNKNKGNKKKDKKNKKKSKKNKKNKKKCQKEGNTCNSALNQPHMEVKASCKDDAWVFESQEQRQQEEGQEEQEEEQEKQEEQEEVPERRKHL